MLRNPPTSAADHFDRAHVSCSFPSNDTPMLERCGLLRLATAAVEPHGKDVQCGMKTTICKPYEGRRCAHAEKGQDISRRCPHRLQRYDVARGSTRRYVLSARAALWRVARAPVPRCLGTTLCQAVGADHACDESLFIVKVSLRQGTPAPPGALAKRLLRIGRRHGSSILAADRPCVMAKEQQA